VDRIAWILNLREPFGAALGRELVSRGWKVIGGDPEASGSTGDAQDTGEAKGKLSLSEWLKQEQSAGERSILGSRPASHREASGDGGETEGPKLGENLQVPTGTGTSGLNDFEGSVGYGPETNDRRTERSSAELEAAGSEGTHSASSAAEAAASSAAPLPEHGRLHVVPLSPERPGALEQAARLTAGLTGRIDLLVLNAGDSVPAWGEAAGSAAAAGGTAAQQAGAAGSAAAGEAASAHGGRAPGLVGGTSSAFSGEASAGHAADLRAAEPWSAPIDHADTTEGRLRDYGTYALTPLQAAEQLLPLMEAEGGLRRICFVSSHEGSVSAGDLSAPIGRAMARTALHMQAKLLFNDLRREGYTFRLYDPGLSPPRPAAPLGGEAGASGKAGGEAMASLPGMVAESARFAAGFFMNPHADEGRLVLTGSRGEEWPF